jgi:hypothetical protein
MQAQQNAFIKRKLFNILGILSIILALVLNYFHDKSFNLLIVFIEQNISPDGHVDKEAFPIVACYFSYLKTVLFFLFFVLTPSASLISHFFINKSNYIFDKNQLVSYFSDDLFLEPTLAKKFFKFTTSIAIMACIAFLIAGEPPHESILESVSTFSFLIASIFCFYGFFSLRGLKIDDFGLKHMKAFLWCFGFILIFIAGEEESWGQRIFGFETFGIFESYNYQKETTMHNFFNPLFVFIYPAIGISFFVVVLLLQLIPSKNCPKFILLITPPPSFIILIFIMAGFSFKGYGEAFEELLAFFFVVYFYRMLLIIRKQTPQNATGKSLAIK